MRKSLQQGDGNSRPFILPAGPATAELTLGSVRLSMSPIGQDIGRSSCPSFSCWAPRSHSCSKRALAPQYRGSLRVVCTGNLMSLCKNIPHLSVATLYPPSGLLPKHLDLPCLGLCVFNCATFGCIPSCPLTSVLSFHGLALWTYRPSWANPVLKTTCHPVRRIDCSLSGLCVSSRARPVRALLSLNPSPRVPLGFSPLPGFCSRDVSVVGLRTFCPPRANTMSDATCHCVLPAACSLSGTSDCAVTCFLRAPSCLTPFPRVPLGFSPQPGSCRGEVDVLCIAAATSDWSSINRPFSDPHDFAKVCSAIAVHCLFPLPRVFLGPCFPFSGCRVAAPKCAVDVSKRVSHSIACRTCELQCACFSCKPHEALPALPDHAGSGPHFAYPRLTAGYSASSFPRCLIGTSVALGYQPRTAPTPTDRFGAIALAPVLPWAPSYFEHWIVPALAFCHTFAAALLLVLITALVRPLHVPSSPLGFLFGGFTHCAPVKILRALSPASPHLAILDWSPGKNKKGKPHKSRLRRCQSTCFFSHFLLWLLYLHSIPVPVQASPFRGARWLLLPAAAHAMARPPEPGDPPGIPQATRRPHLIPPDELTTHVGTCAEPSVLNPSDLPIQEEPRILPATSDRFHAGGPEAERSSEWLGVHLYTPHYKPLCLAVRPPERTLQATMDLLAQYDYGPHGKVFDTVVALRPQRFSGCGSFVRFSSSIRGTGLGGQVAVIADLTHVGGALLRCSSPP